MGINPETYSPSSAAATVSSSGGGSSPTTRHMAQWESARLEAEARLSRESLLFSGGASGAAASSALSDNSGSAVRMQTDFFLKMWNSEVGEAFRGKENGGATASPASSSTKKESKDVKEEGDCKSSISDEMEDSSDETYQMYLNLVGDDMALGHLLQGGLDGISLFGVDPDLAEEGALDIAFG